MSAVFPRGNSTIAIYRQQFINSESNFTFGGADNKVDLNGSIYGLGMGIKASDMASLGFSVGFAQLDYFFEARKTAATDSFIHQVDGSDTSEYYAASLLLSPIESLSLGMVYRYGPEFDTRMDLISVTNRIIPVTGPGIPSGTTVTVPTTEVQNMNNHMKVPDVYGVGISFRPIASLTIAADYNRIKYSQLADQLIVLPAHAGDSQDDFQIDDADEYHAGAEYVLDLGGFPLALRAGYYFRPDHRFYYTGNNSGTHDMYHEGEDENIYAGGLGMVLGEKVQLDAAAMIGDFTKEYTVSMVYRY